MYGDIEEHDRFTYELKNLFFFLGRQFFVVKRRFPGVASINSKEP